MKRRILLFGVLPLLGQQCLLGIFLTGTGCTSPEMTVSEPPTHRGLLATSASFPQARPKQSASVKPATSTKTAPKSIHLTGSEGTQMLDLTGDGKPETINTTFKEGQGTGDSVWTHLVKDHNGTSIFKDQSEDVWIGPVTSKLNRPIYTFSWTEMYIGHKLDEKHYYKRTTWCYDPVKNKFAPRASQWTVGKCTPTEAMAGKVRFWEGDLADEWIATIKRKDKAAFKKAADQASLEYIEGALSELAPSHKVSKIVPTVAIADKDNLKKERMQYAIQFIARSGDSGCEFDFRFEIKGSKFVFVEANYEFLGDGG